MKFLVVYDIPQEYNRIRSRIVRILQDHGLERIEFSVFLGDLTRNEAETVSMKLESVVQKVPADVRLFALCQNCLDKSIIVKEKNEIWNKTYQKGVQFI
ncbi:MAG: CRISPR-associated endonuclease Cas2 [Candidatus Helarchaeota archaeon]